MCWIRVIEHFPFSFSNPLTKSRVMEERQKLVAQPTSYKSFALLRGRWRDSRILVWVAGKLSAV